MKCTRSRPAAQYLAQADARTLALSPPDLAALQRSVNDIYYRFNLDRYGFDLVRIYDADGRLLVGAHIDPDLEQVILPARWLDPGTPSQVLTRLNGGVVLAGSVPILRGGEYLGQAVVGRLVGSSYRNRLKQAVNAQLLLDLDGQIDTSLSPADGRGGLPPTVATTLAAAAQGTSGTAAWTIGGQTYAAAYGL